MADLIEKIGRFFAEQEIQIQESLSQLTNAPLHVPSSSFEVRKKISTPLNAEGGRETFVTYPIPKHMTSKCHIPRHFSVGGSAVPFQYPSVQDGFSANNMLDSTHDRSKTRDISSFVPLRPSTLLLPAKNARGQRLSCDLASLTSSSLSTSTTSTKGSGTKDDDYNLSQTSSEASVKQRKPRPPQQKHRKHKRKKKRASNQEEDQADPKAVAEANAEKVKMAQLLAQERAKCVQAKQLQLERERESERQEAALRLQEQMMRIEAIRAKSFRSTTVLSPPSNDSDIELACDAETKDTSQKGASPFMVDLEARLHGKMSLEMHLKQNCIEKHKRREYLCRRLEKVFEYKGTQSAKVAQLAATKASLELALAAVLEETSQMRQQRKEREIADEKERVERQRKDEKEFQVRLREEEWSDMMADEKLRSKLAAEARVNAGKRVQARSAKLEKLLHAHLFASSYSNVPSNGKISNNNGSDDNNDEYDRISSVEDLRSQSAQQFELSTTRTSGCLGRRI